MSDITLIIPDIHNQVEKAERIIAAEKPGQIIFLGDYFDSWGDNAEMAKNTASWLKHSLSLRGRIHLWGNHDISYVSKNRRCSGYDEAKKKVIDSILNEEDWDRLNWFYIKDEILFTHAGLSESWLSEKEKIMDDIYELLAENVGFANRSIKDGSQFHHWFTAVGKVRGGSANCGGLLWCDKFEFVPIKGVRQVFGHTKVPTPRWINENNLLLDTGLKHYALLDDGKIIVKEYAEL